MSQDRMRDLLRLRYVPRWSVVNCNRSQSVAEHSFGVAVIAMEICRFINNNSPFIVHAGEIMRWALVHDGPECFTGDVPNPFKRAVADEKWQALVDEACPWYSQEIPGHPEVSTVVALADTIEAMLWAMDHAIDTGVTVHLRQRLDVQVKAATARFGWTGLDKRVSDMLAYRPYPVGLIEPGTITGTGTKSST